MIVGRAVFPISCSARTIYRTFEKGLFDSSDLPTKDKRKPSRHQEGRGEQAFRHSIHGHEKGYGQFSSEFGHLKGNTIVSLKHRSAVIALAEQLSKVAITLKPCGRQAVDIEKKLNQWFESVPKNLFKSITFDCGKESSGWKQINNVNDIAIHSVDSRVLSRRGLNESPNGLLCRGGSLKSMDFNSVDEPFIQSVASERSNISRKSLDY